MGIHSPDAQMKFSGDLLAALAQPDQVEDFKFAVGQLFQRNAATLWPTLSGESVQDASCHFFAHVSLTTQNVTNGLYQFLRTLALHDVAASPRPKEAFGIVQLVVHGETQHRHLGVYRLDVFHQFEAASAGDAYV